MFCSKCSAQIPDNSKFCGVCGAPVQTTYGQTSYTPPVAKEYTLAEEKESLDNFARFFKYERLAWKIEGIVMLVISCLFAGLGFIFFMATIAEEFFAGVPSWLQPTNTNNKQTNNIKLLLYITFYSFW